jgi:hypothetical protein
MNLNLRPESLGRLSPWDWLELSRLLELARAACCATIGLPCRHSEMRRRAYTNGLPILALVPIADTARGGR